MDKEAFCDSCGSIAVFSQVCDEILASYFTTLFETVYRAVNLCVHVAIVDEWFEVVVFDDIGWDELHVEFYILWFW